MTFKKQLYSPTSFFSPVPYASTPLTSVTPSVPGTHEPTVSAISFCGSTNLGLIGKFLRALDVSDKDKRNGQQKRVAKLRPLANLCSRYIRSWKSRKSNFLAIPLKIQNLIVGTSIQKLCSQ